MFGLLSSSTTSPSCHWKSGCRPPLLPMATASTQSVRGIKVSEVDWEELAHKHVLKCTSTCLSMSLLCPHLTSPPPFLPFPPLLSPPLLSPPLLTDVELGVVAPSGHMAIPLHLTDLEIRVRPRNWGVRFCSEPIEWLPVTDSAYNTGSTKSCDAIGDEDPFL